MTDLGELLLRDDHWRERAALMDAWARFGRRVLNVQRLDYALLGRWIGHFPRGRFLHDRIASADPVRGERPFGWFAAYAIDVAFALPLLAISGPTEPAHPRSGPMLVGIATIATPWLVMQPAMGAGIAASRPGSSRSASPSQGCSFRRRTRSSSTSGGSTRRASETSWPP